MRITKPMRRALIRIVDNETIGARNPFRYNDQTMRALFRRVLVVHARAGIKPSQTAIELREKWRAEG